MTPLRGDLDREEMVKSLALGLKRFGSDKSSESLIESNGILLWQQLKVAGSTTKDTD